MTFSRPDLKVLFTEASDSYNAHELARSLSDLISFLESSVADQAGSSQLSSISAGIHTSQEFAQLDNPKHQRVQISFKDERSVNLTGIKSVLQKSSNVGFRHNSSDSQFATRSLLI